MEEHNTNPVESLESKHLDAEELKQEPQMPQPRDPRVAILETIKNNYFFDAGLQNIGYIILGTAVKRHPAINNKLLNPADNEALFDKRMAEQDTARYGIQQRFMVSFRMDELLDNLEMLSDTVGTKILSILDVKKMVPGTLRILARAAHNTEQISLDMVWIEEKQ